MRFSRWQTVWLVMIWLLAAAAAYAQSGLARHKRIFAVPAPGKVVIDGKLDDWDLSGQLEMYVTKQTSDMQGARFALMYDAEAIYVCGVVRDASPMMNRHDPKVDPDWAWDGDACQFRLVMDGSQEYPAKGSVYGDGPDRKNDQMAQMTLWYYTDRKEPNVHIQYGMEYAMPKADYPKAVIPHEKFQAIYVKDADGRGYTFEYRLPWSTLGAKKPPKAGDLVAGTVQFNWSEATGMHTAGGSAWAYDVMAGPGFTFQSAGCWGKVIFSEKGKLPRELVEEGLPPEPRLPLSFSYDLPADGEVSIALFDDNGLVARSLVAQGARRAGKNTERWDGLDDNGKPIAAGTYHWRGLYHQPVTTKFLFSVANSGQPPYKTDDNTGGWGGDHGWPTCVCPVQDGMVLAWNACESGWGIIRTDLSGKKQWGNKHNAHHMATDGKRLFVAGDEGYQDEHYVRVFDLADCRPILFANGKSALQPPAGGDVKRDIATGVAYAQGIIYVSWGARDLIALYDAATGDLKETWNVPSPQRLAVRPDGSLAVVNDMQVLAVRQGKVTPLLSTHLDTPTGIAVGTDGTLYVANQGALQQISVFSADGKYLRAIGKQGGRPALGHYDKTGMLNPGGIGIDGKGRVWVAENINGPKRVSVWNAATGKLDNEFFGGSAYSTFSCIDPKHPDEIHCENVVWKVDWKKNTWYPTSTHWRPIDPNSPSSDGSGYGGFNVLTAKNGRQYAWCSIYGKGGCLFIRQGDIFKPYIHLFLLDNTNDQISYPPYPLMGDIKQYPKGNYIWVDKNGDGILQPAEITRQDYKGFNWVDSELNLWAGDGSVYRPLRIEKDGRPVYDFTKPDKVPVEGYCNPYPLFTDPDGSIYTITQGEPEPSFARWTREGKLLWGYQGGISWPKALSKPPAQPGKLWGPTSALGVAGDFVGVAVYFGVFHVYTRDGLYVAMLYKDGRTAGGLGPEVNACETFAAQMVKPDGMNRYFLLAGDQDGRVSEILGLDTIKRLPGGAYTHTAENVQAATEALAEYERMKARAQSLDIVRGRNGLAMAKGITKYIDANQNFTVRTAYDEKNLYVAYEVTSAGELTNSTPDPNYLFKGGNCLDIQLATDPNADPLRKTPAPGDLRILVSQQGGKPIAMIYRAKVQGFTGAPIVFTSPTGTEPFDRIEQSDRITLEYAKQVSGFRATVTIPLDLIGWRPKPGTTVKMDLGYIFGNTPGTQAMLRSYWSNNSFTANVLNDVPNESRLEPKEWGIAGVE